MSKSNYKRLGDYIRLVDVRNKDLEVTKLVGLTINKSFIPSVANVIGTDLSNYKVISHDQFACSLMQVSRDEKMPVAIFEGDKAIMSPAYPMFEVVDKINLLPQYLMMWFSRNEFDREASFYAVGGVRGSLTWDDFCDLTLPIPAIEQQQKIVAEYETLSNRIRINEQMIAKLEDTAQALYRKMFVDGIDKENLPEGWRMGILGDVAEFRNGKIDIVDTTVENYVSAENMVKNMGGIIQCVSFPEEGRCTEFQRGDILLSNIRPYFKKLWKATFSGGCSNDVLSLITKGYFTQSLLYYTIRNDAFFDYVMAGSNGVKMPRGDKQWIMLFPIIIPNIDAIIEFEKQSKLASSLVETRRYEIKRMKELQSLLLSKIGQ